MFRELTKEGRNLACSQGVLYHVHVVHFSPVWVCLMPFYVGMNKLNVHTGIVYRQQDLVTQITSLVAVYKSLLM